LICIIRASLTGVKNGRNVAVLRIIMQTLLRAVVKGLRKNVLVLKATTAKKENGRRPRVRAKSTTRKKVDAKTGTPENTAVITVRKGAHAADITPGDTAVIMVRKEAHAADITPEDTAVITVRKEAHAEPGTPEDTAVNTIRRENATGLEREQVGLEFLTPVE